MPLFNSPQELISLEDQIINEPKETVKIMDIPSSNTNASLVVSIESSDNSNNGSIWFKKRVTKFSSSQ